MLQHTGEVVEPASEVGGVADKAQKEVNLSAGPADHESTADDQRRHQSIASDFVRSRTHLTKHCRPYWWP